MRVLYANDSRATHATHPRTAAPRRLPDAYRDAWRDAPTPRPSPSHTGSVAFIRGLVWMHPPRAQCVSLLPALGNLGSRCSVPRP